MKTVVIWWIGRFCCQVLRISVVISWQINNLGSKINIRTIIDSLALAAILQTIRKILHDFDINYIQISSPQHIS